MVRHISEKNLTAFAERNCLNLLFYWNWFILSKYSVQISSLLSRYNALKKMRNSSKIRPWDFENK